MKLILTLVLSSFFLSVFAQTNWAQIDQQIDLKRDRGEISNAEWYHMRMKEGGNVGGQFSTWVKDSEPIRGKLTEKKLVLYFAENFQITYPNGNKYAKLYLENRLPDSVDIARIDATLANVQEYFFINNQWIMGRKNSTSICGNSYFTAKLAPNTRLNLELSNDVMANGNEEIKYKITLTIGKEIIESNVIKVHLYSTQIKRLLAGLQK